MNTFLNKFYNIINKIGKQNFILVVFILFVLVVTGLVQTFSLYTTSEGVSLIDGLKTYQFILARNEENSVTIASGSTKNLIITVTNPEEIDLKYGIYYSSTSNLTDIDIGYLTATEYLPNGNIKPNSNYTVTVQVENNSTSNVTINFGVKYGLPTGGELVKESTQYWLEEKQVYLNTIEPGRYIYYVGNNGCGDYSCSGRNANYVDDTDMGYCNSASNKFTVSGWRLAYVNDDIPYLVSAGAPECMSTDQAGNISTAASSNYELTDGVPLHLANLNSLALKYCNNDYAYGSACNSSNTFSFNADDFYQITGNTLSSVSCFDVESETCINGNSLIDNDGDYWIATAYDIDNSSWSANYFNTAFFFSSDAVWNHYSHFSHGVRPVLKLDKSLMVIGGNGTYENPYRIATDTIKVTDLSGWGNHGISRGAVLDRTTGTATTDGSNTFIDAGLANHNFGDTVTLVARVKFNSIDTSVIGHVLGSWEAGGFGIGLTQTNSQLYFQVHTNGEYIDFVSTYTPEANTWYNIVATYNGTSIAIYLNGQPLTLDTSISYATSAVSGDLTPVTVPIYIGGNPETSGTMASGTGVNAIWDDVLIFDRALTAEEIASDYKTEINPTNQDNLILYYDFK